MYLVQTVTSRPRAWSSYTDVNIKNDRTVRSMNSVEEISTYKQDFIEPYSYNSFKTAATTYDFPEHPPKKEKKWSFGNLFRRKKKDESDSSSDDETQKKNFLNKKKRKTDKRKKSSKPVGTFDHIVLPSQNRGSYIIPNGYNKHEESGILSDPSGGFGSYVGRPLPRIPIIPDDSRQFNNQEPLTRNESNHSHNSLASADSLLRRSRRERAKARALARRDSSKHGSSSDEDSQRSYSSSRFKSDESLSKQRDGSLCRRSRTARTERYIRRLSKDDESILNREAMQRQARENWHLKLPDEHANYGRSPSRSPILSSTSKSTDYYVNSASSQPNFSGLFTIPPSHSNHNMYRNSNSYLNNVNNSYNVPTHEYDRASKNSIDINPQLPVTNCFNLRSLSCDANIHKSPSPENRSDVLHVQFPIRKPNNRYRNLSLVEQPRLKQPPPTPPPRDPKRLLAMQVETRPATQYYDKINQPRNTNRASRINEPINHWHGGFRTSSEDHIPTEPKQALAPRPSSVTNETRKQRFINRHTNESTDKFQYLTEKKPRSRKPIFIQSTDKINTSNFNESRNEIPKTDNTNASLNFWKQREEEVKPVKKSTSPQIFTSQTSLQTKIFLPSVLQADLEDKSVDTVDFVKRESSPFKPISSPIESIAKKNELNGSIDSIANELEGTQEVKRKSANLEEALDELEAIYKSLHLGDEDLLERAEQREMSIATKKLIDSKAESYPSWGVSRGAMSDSSFSYELFNAADSPKKKKILKKARTLDRKNDDMAYRKLNKDRANTINNPQTALANVSYLLASPVHGPQDDIDGFMEDESNNEPDITLDDVVYRTIKHANNSLRVIDPQPPFGIPIGPVTPAPNSDYLHAVPENSFRYTFKHKKEPDVVKDDLAFRNLRKDSNKEPALKPLTPDDLENNNIKDNLSKKKRAVRSLSANISNLIEKEKCAYSKNTNQGYENEFNKTSLTDIADAMEIARQILREKENRINATKRAFLSDSETKYRKHCILPASSTETITESRLNFLNEMRSMDTKNTESGKIYLLGDDFLHSKPPRGSTPDKRLKECTPTPTSPDTNKKDSLNSSFEELLTALAVEARETSDRITNELKNLDSDLNKNKVIAVKNDAEELRTNELNKKLSEIDAVSEHAKLCEKLLECVVESTELIASTKTESTPIEEVEHIETVIPESLANIVTTRIEDENSLNPVDVEVHSTSEHDYENLGSDAEFDKAIPLIDEESDVITSKSPFEEHKAELVASFKELNKLGERLIDDESSDDGIKIIKESFNDVVENSGGEECVLEVDAFPIDNECAYVSESKINVSDEVLTYTSNCDIFISDVFSNESDQGESQPSSGFHSNSSNDSVPDENASCVESNYFSDCVDSVDQIPSMLLESLKSPKLVTTAMKKTSECSYSETFSNDGDDTRISNVNNAVVECRPSSSGISRNNSRDSGHTLGKTRSWYGDPIVLAFACSYGVACSYQLASLDVVAILGLLFVIISIAAALILE